MPKLMQQLWDSYDLEVIPRDALITQRQECRRAFYAGAQGVLGLLNSLFDSDREPTLADIVLLETIHVELREFVADVKAGAK